MSSEKKMITLKSSDGETFEVDQAVALESQTIKHMVEDGCAANAIPLPTVTGSNLAKVIEYCRKLAEEGKDAEKDKSGESPPETFDADFIKVDKNVLFDLILIGGYGSAPPPGGNINPCAAAPQHGAPPTGTQHQPPPEASPYGAPSPPPLHGSNGGGYQAPYAAPAHRGGGYPAVAPGYESPFEDERGSENRIGYVGRFKLFARNARKLFSCFSSKKESFN